MRPLVTIFLFFFTIQAFAQTAEEYWANWNKNYPEVDILEKLQFEKKVADSVEKNPKLAPSYHRMAKYSFYAEFADESRPIDTAVLASMKRVFTLTNGSAGKLDELVKSEVLFKVGDQKLWMPIQVKLATALKEEAKKGDKVKLFCLFMSEHTHKNILYNSLLISEFNK